MNRPIDLFMLVMPDVHLLDLASPAQIFAHPMLSDNIRLRYIAPAETLCSYQGLQLAGLEPLPDALPSDAWLMLIGAHTRRNTPYGIEHRRAVQWLRDRAVSFQLVAGICSGTLMAARAGLLDGRRCTTHHDLIETLRLTAPLAKVQADCIFVNDGPLWTSAGITTGLDLCLQLVADHWGQSTALTIARELVLYQRRSGQEAQLSFWLDHRNHLQSRIHRVQDLIMAEPGKNWSLTELALRVHISERHLSRLFKQATGTSLQDYLQLARLELARQLLVQTRLSLSVIAERCGFQAERSFRRTWARWRPDTPARYRRSQDDGLSTTDFRETPC